MSVKIWQRAQLIRKTTRRFPLISFTKGLPVALGFSDLDRRLFKVTHQFYDELPQIGEQLELVQGRPQEGHRWTIRIAGIVPDPDGEDQVVYSFELIDSGAPA